MGKAQTFYICDDNNVSTASEIEFSNNGTTVNGTLATTDIDSITMQIPNMHFVGGDMSMLTKYEAQKATYYTNTGTKITDLLTYVKEQGWNTIRVRLFVDPSNDSDKGVCQDIEYVKALGKRIKDAGMLLMLDFHYSDTWADPAKQWTPAEWLSLNNDQLYTKIYEYTKDCLEQMNAAGASPDFIQTGNEISYGMLWGATGSNANRCYVNSDANWPRFTTLLKQAGKACREICPQAKIILHIEIYQS
jgi:arabinogalactan endo-1,4-beta-galactosidase